MRCVLASLAVCLALAACNSVPKPPPGVDRPAPLRTDPAICADVRKTPARPAGANLPQPVTPEERSAAARFLTWVADVLDVAGENEGRAELARETCRPS